jgi:hypothetical protein
VIQPVSDIGSNAEENIAHAAKIIGRSQHRRLVFNAIYTGKTRIKCVSSLMEQTSLSRNRVLDAGKALADNRLVRTTKLNSETCYEKIDFYHRHKAKILSLVASPAKLRSFPTKRNPKPAGPVVKLRISSDRAQIKQLSLDDIESFRRVRGKKTTEQLGDEYSESEFKEGIKNIVGEGGQIKDWGGEVSDLYTTRLMVGHRRTPVAIALKGPGASGKLTPGKMGKNGDQIQRLFEAPAELFLVQYCRQIDQSVTTQMERLAVAKSVLTGKVVRYGVIDGQDSRRLVVAYPKAFPQRTNRKSRPTTPSTGHAKAARR